MIAVEWADLLRLAGIRPAAGKDIRGALEFGEITKWPGCGPKNFALLREIAGMPTMAYRKRERGNQTNNPAGGTRPFTSAIAIPRWSN